MAAVPTFAASHNASLLASITPTDLSAPWYYTPHQHLLPFISDRYLSLAAPVITYWVLSTLFHILDEAKLSYFEARRIHPSEELESRNRVTFWEVIRAVVVQHVIQTTLGLLFLESDESILASEINVDHVAAMKSLAPRVADAAILLLGPSIGPQTLRALGPQAVAFVYWWAIPFVQMILGFFFIDTYEYWLHRAMHTFPTLYRMFHSHHHRLYVPYAFGALYNQWFEGLLLDSAGALLASAATFMTIRQATLLFTIASWKTVDDHCGYRLWWDPCQLFFNNNADYHDIHHQNYGLKYNFAQPFFTNWDYILGTQMTREQAEVLRSRGKDKGEKEE